MRWHTAVLHLGNTLYKGDIVFDTRLFLLFRLSVRIRSGFVFVFGLFGFDISRLRIVQPRSQEESLAVIWDILASGNSHTVVANSHTLTAKELESLENAAYIGGTRGLLLRQR